MPTDEERKKILDQFREITQTENDDDMCTQILERHQWNVEAAVHEAITTNNVEEDVDATAKQFKENFQHVYGATHPNFITLNYRNAVSKADRDSKLLFIYIHSPDHESTDEFCHKTLSSSVLSDFLNENMYCWAGSIQASDGYRLGQQLGAATFPFYMMLVCTGGNAVRVAYKAHGTIEPEKLMGQLSDAMERSQQILNSVRSERTERQEASLLRQEQDREYQASLEADRLREAEAQKEEENRRQFERDVQQEQEAREQEQQDRRQQLEKKKIALQHEIPRKGEPGTSFIRFQLCDGGRIERCFNLSDRLERVRDFVDVNLHERNLEIVNYELAMNYPRRVWGPEEANLTIEEAGWFPQAVLYVQNLDS